MTNHDSPSKVGTVWSRQHGSLFPINIQYPHFISVVQSPFDNWHSPFSPTTFFEIAVYWQFLKEKKNWYVIWLGYLCTHFDNKFDKKSRPRAGTYALSHKAWHEILIKSKGWFLTISKRSKFNFVMDFGQDRRGTEWFSPGLRPYDRFYN